MTLACWQPSDLLIMTSFALIFAVSAASRQPHQAIVPYFFTTLA